MVELTRRDAVRALGVVALAGLAGCADDGGERMPAGGGAATDGTDEPTAEPEDTMTDDPSTDRDELTEVSATVHQIGRGLSEQSWDRDQRPGICAVFRSASEAEGLVENADEATREFVSSTPFDSSVLVYVESVGPTSCYDEVAISDLGLDSDDVLRGRAAAVDTSEGTTACQDVVTHPAAFVRVDTEIRSAALSVTDGWGQTAMVRSRDAETASSLGER